MSKGKLVLMGMAALLLSFALVLTACPDGDDDGGDDSRFESNAQVYQSDGTTLYTGSGKVELWARPSAEDSKDEKVTEVGTVTDGKLTIAVSGNLADKYLNAMPDMPESITVTPADAKMANGYLYLVESADSSKGISFGKSTEQTSYSGIGYMYFNKAAKMTGSTSDEDSTSTYTIDAKAGWNKVYYSMTNSEGTYTSTYTTDLSSAPSDLKWTIENND